MFLPLALALQFDANRVVDHVNPYLDIVELSDKALLLMPPKLVVREHVLTFAWSSDGHYLLYGRNAWDKSPDDWLATTILPGNDQTPIDQLGVWETSSKNAEVMFDSEVAQMKVKKAEWLRGADAVVALLVSSNGTDGKSENYVFEKLDPNSDSHVLASGSCAPDWEPYWQLSPSRPLGFFVESSPSASPPGSRTRYGLITQGAEGLQLLSPGDQMYPEFDSDGSPIFVKRSKSETGASIRLKFEVDPASGQIADSGSPFQFKQEGEVEPVLEIEKSKVGVQSLSIPVLRVKGSQESDHSEALVASQCENGALSPDGAEVAYVTQGSLFVRDIVPISLDALRRARLRYDRTLAMEHAKEIGLAAIMFANDYDDNFPSAVGFINGISPYLNDPDALQGFRYLPNGQNDSSFASPADTVMGTIQLGDGIVTVYVDGHVKFIPNGQ